MKQIRKEPEVEIARSVAQWLTRQGADVRFEVPAPFGGKHRLDVLAVTGAGGVPANEPGELIAVSTKVSPSVAAFADAERWVRGCEEVYLAVRASVALNDRIMTASLRALSQETGVGLLVVDAAGVSEWYSASPNFPRRSDRDAMRKAWENGSTGLLAPGGSAGGKVMKNADVDAERAIEHARANGQTDLAAVLGTTDEAHLKRVAAAINAKSARHLGVMARKWGEGYLVMRR